MKKCRSMSQHDHFYAEVARKKSKKKPFQDVQNMDSTQTKVVLHFGRLDV